MVIDKLVDKTPVSEPIDSLQNLRDRVRYFVAERDWQQFHSPKNLAMALSVEVAELVEIFQWLNQAESKSLAEEAKAAAEAEIADVLIYLVRIADVLDIDLLEAAGKKVDANAKRYPAERVRGLAKKYTEYD